MAAASAVASSPQALEAHPAVPVQEFSVEASSSSSSRAVEARPVSCNGGGEECVLERHSPWVAAAEAESRLGEAASAGLYLRVEKLAEEELRDNRQRQDDELMALEAIYGDDLAEFENKGELRYFQIYIHYDLHDGVEVCAKLSSANDSPKDVGCPDDGTEEHGDRPDEFSYTCNFEYLPPLVLTCLLPLSYPSKDPPYFTATAKWMDGPDVSQLCEMPDNIWAELPGQEVVCQWVEGIRNSSFSYLRFDGKITLGPDIATHKLDNRAISRSLPLESVIPSMLSYSSKKHYEAFLQDFHMCMICLNQTKGSNFIKLPCQHLFCVKCMETLCGMHVKEDVVHCPRCSIGCLGDEDYNAQCPKCCFVFCSLCKDPRHPGKECLTPEQKLQRLQASGKMTASGMVEEMMSIKMLYGDARSCPKCKMTISKTEGCNKVVCISCGQAFCFLCGKAIISGYGHFSKRRDLFEPGKEDTKDWQNQMNWLEIRNRIRAQKHPVGSTVKCPKCRQKIYKDNVEYIFCRACQASYCTLCRKQVEFTGLQSDHWGSPQCVGIKF
ncbi:hypothetical protein BRADI_5g20120v3 [Brachypodium distachyon]|uniref:RBR-type E3 ubiquitin transferase n=1 Tax=Brachypodium distachyon TaxID=15368 RepID=A0A2K2CI90_BRADI|nr:hypothetical protein BRADI_5g20120v3 [Brachypodium distachyon]